MFGEFFALVEAVKGVEGPGGGNDMRLPTGTLAIDCLRSDMPNPRVCESIGSNALIIGIEAYRGEGSVKSPEIVSILLNVPRRSGDGVLTGVSDMSLFSCGSRLRESAGCWDIVEVQGYLAVLSIWGRLLCRRKHNQCSQHEIDRSLPCDDVNTVR